MNSNWFKKAQAISSDSLSPHPRIVELKRKLSAEDEEGNYIDVLIVPVVSEGREYITVQLDATHGGKLPASSVLVQIYESLLKTKTGLERANFIDDYFSEEEATLPKGSYKASSLELLLGPATVDHVIHAINSLCESWESECEKLIKLNLINSYSISDARSRQISGRESENLSNALENIFKKDVEQVRIFICRLLKFISANPNLKRWTDELYKQVTDWVWRSIHINPFPGHEEKADYCSRPLDPKWIERFSSNMDSPVLEIFNYISGKKVPNFDEVMETIKDMPADVENKRGLEAFIGYVSKEGEEESINLWMRNVSRDKEMFSNSILSHPWAVSALNRIYPELAAKLKDMQKNK